MNNFFKTTLTLAKIGDGYRYIWYRNFLQFRRTFFVSLFWVILEPLMYLGAIGFGVGSYINNIKGQSYIDFFFPGLLCSTAMMVPFFEGTYTNFTKLTFQKIYQHILLTRITPQEIVFGEMLWATSKGYFGVLGLSLIALFLGLIQDWHFILILIVLLITCWLFSCLAMLITSVAKNYDSFIYATSGFIIPMSLISGLYFPIEQQPLLLQIIAYILPLSHSIDLCRAILRHDFMDYRLYLHISYLLFMSYALYNLSSYKITKKLIR
ncbi:MAG: ABC transporter permease [Bdellovibrionaceae bacterium]|nr:ABC transporter permease [Pseudobdellovibrionaceae bacterium]NUM57637.1 ABC transporter permease [Pseudobdellovibrionaceae bacterium]